MECREGLVARKGKYEWEVKDYNQLMESGKKRAKSSVIQSSDSYSSVSSSELGSDNFGRFR